MRSKSLGLGETGEKGDLPTNQSGPASREHWADLESRTSLRVPRDYPIVV